MLELTRKALKYLGAALTSGSGYYAVLTPNTAAHNANEMKAMAVGAGGNTIITGGSLATEGGPGIAGIAETLETSVERVGSIITTRILIDITGLNCGGTAGDIIGADGTGAAYLCQLTAAECGTIQGGRMVCLEAPGTGDADIDLYAATEATGVEDTAIATLTETLLCNSGANSVGTTTYFAAAPAAGQYLYLVGQGTGNTTYTAGKFLIEITGIAA